MTTDTSQEIDRKRLAASYKAGHAAGLTAVSTGIIRRVSFDLGPADPEWRRGYWEAVASVTSPQVVEGSSPR